MHVATIFLNFYISDDSVYIGNKPKSHVEEYVLNDVGKVYTGSYKRPIGRDWAFGQFEETVLPAAVYILDKVPSIIDVESVGEGGGIHKIQIHEMSLQGEYCPLGYRVLLPL